jgi:hypothetical protein
MKKTGLSRLLFTVFLFIASIVSGQEVAGKFKNLAWIAGSWKLTNANKGETGREQWTQFSDTAWQGLGVTLSDRDTVSREKLNLILKNERVYYIADVRGNPEPVWYQLTEITNNGFVCENLEYDFPKRIEYRKQGKKIKATISGDDKFIEYVFKKE